ncbi:SMODS domain-containing nucleotidyltransferase [Candidatus Poriferisocius sp.]|uniref:SMODS domain-containing nucleotidyltransferase n=1 Tax=Candidatus Poriferisocius sp. TaxID=3101276 RepID=UPI003B023FAE
MRHTPTFNKFLTNVVNLPQHRLDQLETNVDAIFAALVNSDIIGHLVIAKIPQGSWSHRTIIRPVDDLEFDADFLLHLEEDVNWSANPRSYLIRLEQALRTHGVYGDMIDDETKSRCVRVIYANNHHVDIVPYLTLADGRKVIVCRDDNDWEDTNPERFISWMQSRDETANNNLRKVIRLVKYLRDYHDAFPDVPSIIITKLIGDTITTENKYNGRYGDVPSTLYQVMIDLNYYLQANPYKPTIEDPSGACDPQGNPVTFDHRWNDTIYHSFRSKMHHYTTLIKVAYRDSDYKSSMRRWQEIFGEDFEPTESVETASSPLGPPVVVPASTSASRAG